MPSTLTSLEPLLVHSMRRNPSGEVRFIPASPAPRSGTSTRGFLAELDEYVLALSSDAEAARTELAASQAELVALRAVVARADTIVRGMGDPFGHLVGLKAILAATRPSI